MISCSSLIKKNNSFLGLHFPLNFGGIDRFWLGIVLLEYFWNKMVYRWNRCSGFRSSLKLKSFKTYFWWSFYGFQIPEVQSEINQTKYKVPNLIHFIWFGCSPLRIDHYLAYVRSVYIYDVLLNVWIIANVFQRGCRFLPRSSEMHQIQNCLYFCLKCLLTLFPCITSREPNTAQKTGTQRKQQIWQSWCPCVLKLSFRLSLQKVRLNRLLLLQGLYECQ